MDCPRCQLPMLRGRTELRSQVAVRVLTDSHASGARLHFIDERSGEATPAPLGLVAHRCDSCDAVLLEGEGLGDGLECFECGAAIGADADACPACGWTW